VAKPATRQLFAAR